MDVEVFLRKYFEEIKFERCGKGYDISFPFKFCNDDRIPSFYIEEDDSGAFTVTDNGNTFKYLEYSGVNTEDYKDKIAKICKLYRLENEGGIIKKVLGDYQTNMTFVQLTGFMVGISHIAMIKNFCGE